jgi:DNA polymerase-3 subunit delta'
MDNFDSPPWFNDALKLINGYKDQDCMPHALFIYGNQGLGKKVFSNDLAKQVVCGSPSQNTDTFNKRSSLFHAGTHPDFKIVKVEDKASQIKIDQIRESIEWLSLTKHNSEYKVLLITAAEKMNRFAANSMLKILEEPPAGTLIILVSDRPAGVLSTLKSRCAHIMIKPPNFSDAVAWLSTQVDYEHIDELLHEAGGMPYKALFMHNDGVYERKKEFIGDFKEIFNRSFSVPEFSQKWKDENITTTLEWLMSITIQTVKSLNNIDYPQNNIFYSVTKQKLSSINNASHKMMRFYENLLRIKEQNLRTESSTLAIEDACLSFKKFVL